MSPRHLFLFTTLCLSVVGCAHAPTSRLHLAQMPAIVCKHCNCYMPAGAAADAACTVCDCHQITQACERGR